MKKFSMKYGKDKLHFTIPEENLLGVLTSDAPQNEQTEAEIIKTALANPIGSRRLAEIVKPGEQICIVISDITRSWQRMGDYLPYLVEELQQAGVKAEDIMFLSATGSHRKQTQAEHNTLLGEKLAGKFKVIDHVAKDEASLVYLGETSYGTPVKINKLAAEADHIILTGAIVFHLLAGWGGGKKSVLPGIAGYESIMANHAMSLGAEPGSGSNPEIRSGKIKGNPIYADMLEAARMAEPSFLLNVIMGSEGEFAAAVAGDFYQAHEKGCQIVDQLDSVPIAEQADLVVATAGGYPKDINFYQTIKTVINAEAALKKNGVMIILSYCNEGFGNEAIQKIIQDYDTVLEREEELRRDYTIAKYVGYYVSEVAQKYNFILVSSLDPASVAMANIRVVDSIEKAFALAKELKGDNLSTYLMPHGANTFPRYKK
ncbi:nickel-dependent lactate racemase [Halanaerobium salsuginis]|jgi:nickel-dependent lactate racemase|uniref:Nickel-dependent lactate racemase n=1 Tax=Halanaerobium salsuginis TaxID=29563 RepID=A0A1I4GMY0_9FIRM|nr:nickel-dependent lactate racemase [Halanaerobium salsuginis]SFL31325.1 Nickel-dependent lactate racemase [Halanaerobium salsuginis]